MKVKVGNSETGSFRKGFISFIRHQASEIREGGWPVLLRKLRTFLKLLPLMPIVLIVRALRPFVLIRFGALRSENIGHFVGNTEMYLCRRDAGIDNQRAFDVFYYQGAVCNQQLKKMWERTLHVYRLARSLDFVNHTLPRGEEHVIPNPRHGERDIHGLMSRIPAHLYFTSNEERLGCKALQAMGIHKEAPFICFHSRDSAYLESTFPNRDLSFFDCRNSSISNKIAAADEMTRRGYFAVRMGAVVKEPLQTANPMIIDYATNYRSDFMDIFLSAKCHFFIGDASGMEEIPQCCRRPTVDVNFIPLQYINSWYRDNLFIPKKLWLREEQRFLTFREIFDWKIDNIYQAEGYEQLGIEPVENTPEEITALAVEMDERLKGTWQTTKEDEELQRRFWSIFKPREGYHGVIASRIGTDFLRQNRELLK